MKIRFIVALITSAGLVCVSQGEQKKAADESSKFGIVESLEIAEVPSDFRVGFSLLTSGETQYVAYYDKDRRMTVASRSLDSEKWNYQVLPSKVGWDSHNYVTMAVDGAGHLHVSGNMHVVPLIYFRTGKAGDISTLKQFPMTGQDEGRVTYPKFVHDAEGRLVFHYRDGGSGKGREIYNVYDTKTRTWSRLLDQPLVDGEGKMNAYMNGPVMGPDGWFHMHWVWRDSPDCATNHHLSYARTKDLIHWESAFGEKVGLPITLDQKELWVDPIPSGGGIINGGHKLFIDSQENPVIFYHKSDAAGHMQIYAARPKDGKWRSGVLTYWEKPVPFSGRGSMGFVGIRISDASRVNEDTLILNYSHKDHGSGHLLVDEKTLKRSRKQGSVRPDYPLEIRQVQSDFPGMQVQRSEDIGVSPDDDVRYLIRWESLGSNRDRPRQPPLPEPDTLELYKLRE